MPEPIKTKPKCDLLMVAVVQAQDAEVTETRLANDAASVTRLPSLGAFLGRRNATLMIGLPNALKAKVLDILHDNCRQRIEFIAVPLESAPMPMPAPTPITVGGATVFSLEVEYFEEF
ncbi:MAG: cyclic-di-AMP receptor [Anaerolineaceae bacterium]